MLLAVLTEFVKLRLLPRQHGHLIEFAHSLGFEPIAIVIAGRPDLPVFRVPDLVRQRRGVFDQYRRYYLTSRHLRTIINMYEERGQAACHHRVLLRVTLRHALADLLAESKRA